MEHKRFHNQDEARVEDKFETLGLLSLTAEDHKIGKSSEIPDILLKNPGKTLGEVMTDKEIILWIRTEIEYLTEYYKNFRKPDSNFYKVHLPKLVSKFKASLNYLKKIRRLPKEFEDFDPETLVPPKESSINFDI